MRHPASQNCKSCGYLNYLYLRNLFGVGIHISSGAIKLAQASMREAVTTQKIQIHLPIRCARNGSLIPLLRATRPTLHKGWDHG